MDQSLSPHAFRGSIAEAIAEAKRQKKLFVVYTAGDNSDSKLLETSTWTDPNVSEALAKYCILVHILEDSPEASNFSAIYPQHSAPCITAIGYNGVQLWQNEGFVGADVLASSLEKAWLSLHVQETTAAFLTAALASGKQLSSGTSEMASHEQMSPGTSGQASRSNTIENRGNHGDASKETDSKLDDGAFTEPSLANVSDSSKLDESTSKIETGTTSENPVEIVQRKPEVPVPVAVKNVSISNNHLASNKEVSQQIVSEAREVPVSSDDTEEVEKEDASDSSIIKSNDIFLSIRLPDGLSLQVKFSVMDTLKMVRDCIQEKQSSLRSFSIAIPYPRKTFNDQDLDKTLSELGLSSRQALVVVPYDKTNSRNRGASSQSQTYSSRDADSSNEGGYWGNVKRILYFLNPFSYLRGGASSESAAQESESGRSEYSPNSSLRNNLQDDGRPSSSHGSNRSTPANGRNSNEKTSQQGSRFGGNIHTLKHDDGDNRSDDRNTFWNGNSTQYGGNEDGK